MEIQRYLLLGLFWALSANAFADGILNSDKIFVIEFNWVESVAQKNFNVEQISFEDAHRLARSLVSEQKPHSYASVYLLTSPVQATGGYSFQYKMDGDRVVFCLKKPGDNEMVTQAKTNPSAIAIVKRPLAISANVTYCSN